MGSRIGARSSTNARTSQMAWLTCSTGPRSMCFSRPVFTAPSSQPCGPEKSTSLVQLQYAPRFLVDLLPGFTDNRSFLALQQIHYLLPFKLPMPSDSEVLYDFAELAPLFLLAPPSPLPLAPDVKASSTSVMGPLEFR